MPQDNSKHADKLRELGFRKYKPNRQSDPDARYEVVSVEIEGEEDIPGVYDFSLPCFTTINKGMSGVTLAIDESGQMWRHPTKVIDLSNLGFSDALKRHTRQ